MNALDLIVIAGIALSALFAFARGFVKEALSIAAWAGAGFATLYGLAYARPIAQKLITSPTLADIAAGVVLFVGSLIVLSVVTSLLAGRIQHSALSAVDRTLGLLFGVVRGIVIACLAFIALGWAIPQDRDWPVWVRDARSRPFLAQGAELLKSFVPADTRARSAAAAGQVKQTLEQAHETEAAVRALETPFPVGTKPATPAAVGYTTPHRKAMDQLFDSVKDK